MTEENLTENSTDQFYKAITGKDLNPSIDRLLSYLPSDKDQVLVVLKGHLLLEELITEILQEKLRQIEENPLGVKVTDRWMFSKKLEALWLLVNEEWFDYDWKALKELNEIRNKMAHCLEPKGIEEKIDRFRTAVSSAWDESNAPSKGLIPQLRPAIALLWIRLHSYQRSLRNSKKKSITKTCEP
ncbi:hypothetical protein ACJJIQ_09135 [Microbulbifer sp. ANSA003]|uniref:hypothetical protein n=1 Tax=Microbulbifer sp. ANSA003 TaxID=3243360 RepID=UPI004041013B